MELVPPRVEVEIAGGRLTIEASADGPELCEINSSGIEGAPDHAIVDWSLAGSIVADLLDLHERQVGLADRASTMRP